MSEASKYLDELLKATREGIRQGRIEGLKEAVRLAEDAQSLGVFNVVVSLRARIRELEKEGEE